MDKKKKILIFSTAYLPLIGGAELAVKNLTDRLDDFEFDLITAKIKSTFPNNERIGRINVYRVGFGNNLDKLLLPFWGVIKVIHLHKENDYDFIWAIMASYGGLAALLFKQLKPKIKFLLTLQEGDDLEYIKRRAGIFFICIKRIFTSADYIQPISNYLADWARQIGAKCPIEVVPNGVDLEIFRPSWQSDNLNKKILITVSRLVEKNGVQYLIEALPGVLKINPDAQLWIIGDGGLRQELEKMAADLKVKEKIQFFGNKEPQIVAELLSRASMFVRPSLSEGLGNAFLEAMAVGLPTIGTPTGGIVDFLEDGKTGWLISLKNSFELAEKLNYILNFDNKEKVKEISAKGQAIASDYDWNKIAVKMEIIFKKLT